MKNSKGYVMDVQPFSVNDGDGIRTTIFLAGCPLRCKWCSNPEGFFKSELVGWHKRKCIGCSECARMCPKGIGIDMNKSEINCDACGKCVDVCPVGARVFMVREMTADEVIEKVQRHRLFYMQSGGGVTFSGGEATSQPEFLDFLSERIYDLGYDMAIETSGYFEFDKIESVLERMDLIFMDLKIFDDEKHKEYTGVSNVLIKENIAKVAGMVPRKKLVVRIPVIGGVNDDAENIEQTARFVREHAPGAQVELLPYHEFGRIKYEAIGIEYEHPEFTRPEKEKINQLKDLVSNYGIEIADYR
ncbi:MAG: glycyl-radical enzyme activating protein [Firmicutes bacterium]|nr:glycyl-radical enzyme activating protein [Bacillota bacterium]